MSPAVLAIDEQIKPIETTTAYELFTTERSVRKVPVEAEKLVRSAVDDATRMAANTARHPRTKDQGLVALEAIQLALVNIISSNLLRRRTGHRLLALRSRLGLFPMMS